MMDYTNKQLVEMYFSEPDINNLVKELCGFPFEIIINEELNYITVTGPLNGRKWDLQEMCNSLRDGLTIKS